MALGDEMETSAAVPRFSVPVGNQTFRRGNDEHVAWRERTREPGMPPKYGLVEDHGGNVIKPVKGAGSDLDHKRDAAIDAKSKARENKERARGGAGGATTAAQKKADIEAKREADMLRKGEERAGKIKVAEEKLERQHEAEALKPKLSSAK